MIIEREILNKDRIVNNFGSEEETMIFLGSKKSFSDTVLRTINSEVGEINPLRIETLADFDELIKLGPKNICLVIVDAALCRENTQLCNSIREKLALVSPDTGVAIAYWHSDLEKLVGTSLCALELDQNNVRRIQGFLPMAKSIDIWLSVIRLLMCGGTYYPAEIFTMNTPGNPQTDMQVNNSQEAVNSPNIPNNSLKLLTPRENEVMELVVSGLQNKEIASKLSLSEHTVKLHMHHILSKFSAKNRTDAARLYLAAKAG